MLKNLKLGTKLTGGFLVIAMIALGTGLFGYLQIQRLATADTLLYEKGAVALKEIGVMLGCFHRIRVNLRELIIAKDQNEIKKIDERIKQLRTEFGESVKSLENALPDEEAQKLYAQFKETRSSFIQVLDKTMVLANENKDEEANTYLSSEQSNKAMRAEIVAIDNLTNYLQKNAKKIAGDNIIRADRSSLTMMGLSVVGAILAFIFGIVITRSITKPVVALSENASRIAAGDLTSTVTNNATDEIGSLGKSINAMTLQLSDIIGHITESSCSVAAAAVQLQGNTERISVGVKEVENQTISLGTASEEMAATSSDIARNCHAAAANATQASGEAQSGVTVVHETIEDMKRIAERVKTSSQTVATLGSRSEQIGAIVGTIEDIADQTNLLALNAAIEAARAGEQGRGFAVVADEVRALAERTTKATHEISAMIKSIQAETQSAVTTMEIGVKEVERGMETSRRSEEALEGILNSINEVTLQVDQIATAAEEQTATTQEIASNIHRVTSVLDASAHSSRENVEAVAQLTKLAEDLLQQVREFKVAGNDLLIVDLAKNDHKMFVNTIRSAVLGASTLDPSSISTHRTCRFGKWYSGEGQSLCGGLGSFRAIDAPHDQIHSIAKDAVTAINSGNEHLANQLLTKVENLSDEMVNRLDSIKQEYNNRS